MEFTSEEVRACVGKWLHIARSDEELPVILMPFDPEGSDEFEPIGPSPRGLRMFADGEQS